MLNGTKKPKGWDRLHVGAEGRNELRKLAGIDNVLVVDTSGTTGQQEG